MKIERLGYDVYTPLSPICNNMDIQHAILESYFCLRMNEYINILLASFEIIYIFFDNYL
jgi:hypothetical protein